MISITPCRSLVSDRFPVASFLVKAPPGRCFEVACATDPRLFHPRYRGHRTAKNFFASRGAGLLRARDGDATYLVPPHSLREFAGNTRLFYALGVYDDPRGDDARFTIEPDRLGEVPYVQIAPDFTGKALARLQRPGQADDVRYGARAQTLSWGGDMAMARYGTAQAETEVDSDGEGDLYEAATEAMVEEPPGYEDAPDLTNHGIAGTLVERTVPSAPAELLPSDESEPGGVEHIAELPNSPLVPMAQRVPARHPPAHAAVPAGGRYGAVGQRVRAPATRGLQTMAVTPGGEAAPIAANSHEFLPPGRAEDYSDQDLLEVVALSADAGVNPEVDAAPVPFTEAEKRLVLYSIARFESDLRIADIGDPVRMARAYGACNRNTDGAGLSYGFIQFTQASGNLGRLLARFAERDRGQFDAVFGPNAAELLTVTGAGTTAQRLAPVGGTELWQEPWVGRMRAAARIEAFQAEQDRAAIEWFVDPNLRLAGWLGFDTDRSLAMLVDRCIQQGNGGGRSWVVSRVGPLKDNEIRREALRALGFERLRDFQNSVDGLADDGQWGPMTHAAMLASLRALGDHSPIAVPTREQMLDTMVSAAVHEAKFWADRPQRLRSDHELLHDTVYTY